MTNNSNNISSFENEDNNNADKYIERAEKLDFEHFKLFINDAFEVATNYKSVSNINSLEKPYIFSRAIKSLENLMNKSALHNAALAVTYCFDKSGRSDLTTLQECKKIIDDPSNYEDVLSPTIINYINSRLTQKTNLCNYIVENSEKLSNALKDGCAENMIKSFTSQNKYGSNSTVKKIFTFNKKQSIPQEDTIAKIVFEKIVKIIEEDILDQNTTWIHPYEYDISNFDNQDNTYVNIGGESAAEVDTV